ncbi:MAG: response regulator [Elusimicrobia bacterium]|nr:response regulator [Elusimicrobiota bacterium]
MPPAKKLVLIDDDPTLVAYMEGVLKKAGYDVSSALNGQEGLEVAKRVRPDLVLLDMAMPVMHGFQVCTAIRADPELKSVPIVAMSGKSYAVDLKTAKAEGADLYLVKPLTKDQLLDAIERFLPA